MPRPWNTDPAPVKQRVPKPMRANIRTHAKTWFRIEMSARVEPVAISAATSGTSFMGLLRRDRQRGHRLHVGSVRQAVRAFDDHRLLRLDSREDLHHPGPRAKADLDGPEVRLALVDHVGHESLLAGLDRPLWDDQGVFLRLAGQADLADEARLEHPRVLHPGEDLDLAGGPFGYG